MKYSIMLLFAALMLSSCLTPRERLYRAVGKDPAGLAGICADEYPIKERVVPGKPDTVVKTDTVRETKTVVRTVKGKTDTVTSESETVYRYIRQTDTLVQESTALSDSLRIALRDAEARVAEMDYKYVTWHDIARGRMWWMVGLAILSGAFISAYILSKFKII